MTRTSAFAQNNPPPYTPVAHANSGGTPPTRDWPVPATSTTTQGRSSEANERTPLNAGPSFHNRRKSQTAVKAYAILLLLAIVTIFVVFIGLALPDMERQVRRQRRASWTNELREHANLHAEWDRQRVEYEKEGHAMAAERGLWHAERVQWEGERAEHEREHEEWRQEREQREREREEWQKERDDDDRRAAMRLYWDSPLNLGRCQAWGVRHYWGRLWNVETGYNATRACQRTPVVVNDVVLMQPDRCEDRGNEGVFGHWITGLKETSCKPWWGKQFKKGCAQDGRGYRLIESRLWGVADGEDGKRLCETAPADVYGHHFRQPAFCTWLNDHYLAYWKVPDGSC